MDTNEILYIFRLDELIGGKKQRKIALRAENLAYA